jgi:hypothetical protein
MNDRRSRDTKWNRWKLERGGGEIVDGEPRRESKERNKEVVGLA